MKHPAAKKLLPRPRRGVACGLAIAMIAGVSLTAGPAQAIITDDNAASETAPASPYDVNWDYVINYKEASAVLIDDYWLLTAAHVADDANSWSGSISGETYTEVDVVYHNTADLALVRLDKALSDHAQLITGGLSLNDPTVLVGYGYQGTVNGTLFNPDTVTPANGRGIKRWGTNQFDGSLVDFNTGLFTTTMIVMGFNEDDTTYEAGAGAGDSGGAVFVEEGGVWELAGIITNTASDDPRTADAVLAASLFHYDNWVNNTIANYIPEPGAAILFGVPAALLMLRRRAAAR